MPDDVILERKSLEEARSKIRGDAANPSNFCWTTS